LLNAIPTQAQVTLVGHQNLELEAFGAVADSILEILPHNVNHIESTASTASNQASQANNTSQSSHCKSQFQSNNKQHYTKRNVNYGTEPYFEGQRQRICRAHLYFADRARSCKPWCKWPGAKPNIIDPSSRPNSRGSSPVRNS